MTHMHTSQDYDSLYLLSLYLGPLITSAPMSLGPLTTSALVLYH